MKSFIINGNRCYELPDRNISQEIKNKICEDKEEAKHNIQAYISIRNRYHKTEECQKIWDKHVKKKIVDLSQYQSASNL